MNHNVSRAQLLSGDLTGEDAPFRPPWALAEIEFVERCTGCGDCIAVCPDKLIVEGRGKLPQMDFNRGGCDFCEECLSVCKPAALQNDETSETPPWRIQASILSSCLSMNAVICRSCGEVCDERAIQFKLEVGGVATPLLDLDQCTGCGACFAVCPIRAVTLSSINEPRDQAA
ncbi:MAG: ferredoxin-type protein NapF [Sedimenticola sp.]|uniref:Ferredoxin-type protein NapF n=1 Tax=Sedimenticola thiotaurini TaxID=1543721 RepID=A0A558D1T0_9GAMM|nr:ferredoxin-type protein NapF [Sedimenticola sp.]MCW8947327.1 ferredoxin-type protein NapF [Sedimenticola sp.]MCW8975700.1 ferredoxin-type protein NapF [Sedimenticola sp.]TVT54975.1 MAG: ferredoxin-type protein NapF [Sedimenticola thiotaurini]